MGNPFSSGFSSGFGGPDTSNNVANEAILLMGGNQPPVTGFAPSFDNSPNGQALQQLYAPCVATVARQFEWDFARGFVALTLTGNAPPFPWAYEYLYPGTIALWQIMPAAFVDPNNPLPQNWSVGNALVGTTQSRVLWCNLATATGVYNVNPSEATWDPLFREAVVRLLASELATATAGKPETSAGLLQSGAAFETLGEGRPG